MLDAPAEPVRLTNVLGALGREMTELALHASQLQTALSPVLRWTTKAELPLQTLQSLDLITQRLQCVAAFLAVLAPNIPAAWTCDAAAASQAVCLGDLAGRLARPGCESDRPTAAGPGAVELFEF